MKTPQDAIVVVEKIHRNGLRLFTKMEVCNVTNT